MRYLPLGAVLAITALALLSGCGGGSTSSNSAGSSTPTPTPTVAPVPAPTLSPLPTGILIANVLLAPDVAVPSFALPALTAQRNVQLGFERDFPYLTAWAECITTRRDHEAGRPARCVVRSFVLYEVDRSGGRREVARNDFAAQAGGPIECVFTSGANPERVPDTPCHGANYRRERGGQLCWYGWCLVGPAPGDEGISPMSNGFIDNAAILTIDVALEPGKVAHWWTYITTDPFRPRTRVTEGYQYFAEIEFYTEGDSVLRVGADRWAAGTETHPCNLLPGNAASDHCQLFFDDWLQTAARSFETRTVRLDG